MCWYYIDDDDLFERDLEAEEFLGREYCYCCPLINKIDCWTFKVETSSKLQQSYLIPNPWHSQEFKLDHDPHDSHRRFFVWTTPAHVGRFCVRVNGDLFVSDLDTEELFGRGYDDLLDERDIIDDEDHFERDLDAEEFFGPKSDLLDEQYYLWP